MRRSPFLFLTILSFASLFAEVKTMSADDPAVRFVGGSTGPEVRVCTTGAAETNARIGLQFGDALSAQPSFGVKVVEERFLKLYVTPVYVMPGQYETLNLGDYEMLHRVYAQAGITVLVVQEAPLECLALNGVYPNSRNLRAALRGLSTRTDGKVAYVLPFAFAGAAGFTFSSGSRELAVGSNRCSLTLPHELGHALGLMDLYTDLRVEKARLSLTLALNQETGSEAFSENYDWNGGTGSRYYPQGKKHADLVKRHLMYGLTSVIRRDLTLGDVLAISYVNSQRTSYDKMLPPSGVGCLRNNNMLRDSEFGE